MKIRRLKIDGSWEFTPERHDDRRGTFVAWYDAASFVEAVGHPLTLGQTNHVVSRRGALRGIHFAQVPPGQAKYVYCPGGAALDVIVDIRVGSPTFGQWDAVVLDAGDCRAVYLAEGLGHAYVALEDDTVLVYLCSERYNPGREAGVHLLDPDLALPWPAELPRILSDRDHAAPTLAEAREAGLLPTYQDCQRYYRQLRSQRQPAIGIPGDRNQE
jgi:dTDP-4-dehydrorhamnose 3,5-epimerase